MDGQRTSIVCLNKWRNI